MKAFQFLDHTSIHRSIFLHLFRVRSQGQQPKQGSPDFRFPSYFFQLFRGGTQGIVYTACPGSSQGLLLKGHALNTSSERRLGGTLTRLLSHLIWLLNKEEQRFCSQLLKNGRASRLFLWDSPATIWRKLFSAACIRRLLFSVTTQS